MKHDLSTLGIAKKAGLLAIGSEAVASALRNRTASLVITAADASEGSIRRARMNAESNGVAYLAVPYTRFELGSITGRGSPGTIAFLNEGLASSFIKRLEGGKNDEYNV